MIQVAYRTTVKKLEEKRRAVRSYKTGKKLDDGRDETAVEYEFLGYGLVLDGQREMLVFNEPLPFTVGDQVEVIIRKVEQ